MIDLLACNTNTSSLAVPEYVYGLEDITVKDNSEVLRQRIRRTLLNVVMVPLMLAQECETRIVEMCNSYADSECLNFNALLPYEHINDEQCEHFTIIVSP